MREERDEDEVEEREIVEAEMMGEIEEVPMLCFCCVFNLWGNVKVGGQ